MLYLAAEPEREQGRDCYIRSEKHPEEVQDARKLTMSGAELATEKAESNRVRGVRKLRSRNGRQFLPEGRFMMSIPVPKFCASV